MKKGTIIGLGGVCFIVVFAIMIMIFGVNSFSGGEQITANSSERYVLIPQILGEIYGMERWDKSEHVYYNYKGNPIYDYECQKIWNEYYREGSAELHFIWVDVCNHADVDISP